MKETGATHWRGPNTDATNNSGFTGLPDGSCSYEGPFTSIGWYGAWWSSTGASFWYTTAHYLYSLDGSVVEKNIRKHEGLSVRWISDY